MTLQIKHKFVSHIADDPASVAAGEVVPSNWNDTHEITGSVNWGEIQGSLGDQTDLSSALNAIDGDIDDIFADIGSINLSLDSKADKSELNGLMNQAQVLTRGLGC